MGDILGLGQIAVRILICRIGKGAPYRKAEQGFIFIQRDIIFPYGRAVICDVIGAHILTDHIIYSPLRFHHLPDLTQREKDQRVDRDHGGQGEEHPLRTPDKKSTQTGFFPSAVLPVGDEDHGK